MKNIDEKIKRLLSGSANYALGVRLSEKDLYDEIVESFEPTNKRRKGLHRISLNKGGDLRRFGKKTEIPSVMSYLLDTNGIQSKPRVNKHLLNVVAETIYDKLPEPAIKTHKGIKHFFPNLLHFVTRSHIFNKRQKLEEKDRAASAKALAAIQPVRSASTSSASLISPLMPIPAFIPKPTNASSGKGVGKVKIMMNKWNDLVH